MRAYEKLAALWKRFDKVCTDVAAALDERDFEIKERAARRAPGKRRHQRATAALRRR